MLRAVLGEDLAKVKTLVAIDLHTGLGEPGAAEIITEALPGSAAYARAAAIWAGPALASNPARRASRYRRP